MKLVSYNIQYGIGLDGRFDLDRIVASVADADVVAFQEVTRHFVRNGGCDMVAELAERLPSHFSVFGAGMDADMGSSVEGDRAVNRRMQFGNMVFSRFPIASSRNLLLPRSRTYDVLNLQRSALETVILAPGGPIRIYSVHLDHVSSEERIDQIEFLKERALNYGLEGGSVTGAIEFGFPEPPSPEDFVLMGDFNMEPESAEYGVMAGIVEPGERRRHRARHAVDAALVHEPRAAAAYSWVEPTDPQKRKQLDYCFVNATLAPRVRRCWTDYTADGSDHLPVWLELA